MRAALSNRHRVTASQTSRLRAPARHPLWLSPRHAPGAAACAAQTWGSSQRRAWRTCGCGRNRDCSCRVTSMIRSLCPSALRACRTIEGKYSMAKLGAKTEPKNAHNGRSCPASNTPQLRTILSTATCLHDAHDGGLNLRLAVLLHFLPRLSLLRLVLLLHTG